MDIYHQCGAHLLMESVYEGHHFVTEFYDPKIKERAEKINSCPRCQTPLGKSNPSKSNNISYGNF